MEKLNCFRGQFDFTPGRFVYQQVPPEGPKEQGEKREAPKKTPEDARREEQKAEVREKYGDDNLDKTPMTLQAAKDLLSDPKKVAQEVNSMKSMEMKNRPVNQALDLVKNDNRFMKQLIEQYLKVTDHNSRATVLYDAVWLAKFKDDALFEKVFETDNQEPTKEAALRKITDQKILQKIARDYMYAWKGKKNPSNKPYLHPNDNMHDPRLGVFENITDQSFLTTIIDNKEADINMRLKAMLKSTDKATLKRYILATSERDSKEFFKSNEHVLTVTMRPRSVQQALGIIAFKRLKDLESK